MVEATTEASPAANNIYEPKPLVLDNLLVNNVNSWGNVEYNLPLRSSANETRTGTSIAHRHIPDIPCTYDCKIKLPIPSKFSGRDRLVGLETYRTTSGDYCLKPNPNKATERSDCSMNCQRVLYMTSVESAIKKQNIVQPQYISEMKDNFRGLKKSKMAPPDYPLDPPDPAFICDVQASGRNEAPPIPENAPGFTRHLDPYYTTSRSSFTRYTPDQQYASKDQITFYTEFNTPKVYGFGPRFKEIWMPLMSEPHRGVYDRTQFKVEYKEAAAARNPVNYIKGILETRTQKDFKIPFAKTTLCAWDHGEDTFSPSQSPSVYQAGAAPFMYCSDYCLIGTGASPKTVIDQLKFDYVRHNVKPHKTCKRRFIVSKNAFA